MRSFFIERLLWLLIQVFYKKSYSKNVLANFARTYHYLGRFLSCNSMKIVGPVGVSSRDALLRILWNFSEEFYAEQLWTDAPRR